ncbi:MAG: hypothetical protein KU29_07775 [Sulfurovum sp. FS06-10]|nr:MAG: hypothetical protein KU29_07775 [Sulfurovum sp. FS06-10]
MNILLETISFQQILRTVTHDSYIVKHPLTIIQGDMGSGKSILLNAIYTSFENKFYQDFNTSHDLLFFRRPPKNQSLFLQELRMHKKLSYINTEDDDSIIRSLKIPSSQKNTLVFIDHFELISSELMKTIFSLQYNGICTFIVAIRDIVVERIFTKGLLSVLPCTFFTCSPLSKTDVFSYLEKRFNSDKATLSSFSSEHITFLHHCTKGNFGLLIKYVNNLEKWLERQRTHNTFTVENVSLNCFRQIAEELKLIEPKKESKDKELKKMFSEWMIRLENEVEILSVTAIVCFIFISYYTPEIERSLSMQTSTDIQKVNVITETKSSFDEKILNNNVESESHNIKPSDSPTLTLRVKFYDNFR